MKSIPSFANELDTPVPVVDLDIVEKNIELLQKKCAAAGISNLPHFKTHKSLRMAQMQLDAGAAGITCQTLGEAEVLADAGIRNITISYNIIGAAKAPRLRELASRCHLTVAADNKTVAKFISDSLSGSSLEIEVLVECDTGRNRSGVVAPDTAVSLAEYLHSLPNVKLAGFLFYPTRDNIKAACEFLDLVKELCQVANIPINRISCGGTPEIEIMGELGETEYRAGTYIYNDKMMVGLNAAKPDDCAFYVYATIVSNAEEGRAIIDAGSKTLTSDKTIFEDFGNLVDYPDARIVKLAEEHGFLDISNCSPAPEIGEVVRILPNHVCPISNLFDNILLARDGELRGSLKIDARGRVQ